MWNLSYFKSTSIWFIFSGLPIGFVVVENKTESHFWKNLILNNLKLVVFVTFIISSVTFPLILEVILLPIIALIVICDTIATTKNIGFVAKITGIVLGLIGLSLFTYSLYRVLSDIHSIGNISTLKDFMMPVFFSTISIPYMYALKLYSEYQLLFLRLKFGQKRSRKLNFLIKIHLILFCNMQLKKIQIAKNMGNYNIMLISSKEDITDMIESYKNVLLFGKNRRH